jgi:hypothetical protein
MSETTIPSLMLYCSTFGLFHDARNGSDYRLTLKSVNLKYSLLLTGTFKIKTCKSICLTVAELYELRLEDGGSHFEQCL